MLDPKKTYRGIPYFFGIDPVSSYVMLHVRDYMLWQMISVWTRLQSLLIIMMLMNQTVDCSPCWSSWLRCKTDCGIKCGVNCIPGKQTLILHYGLGTDNKKNRGIKCGPKTTYRVCRTGYLRCTVFSNTGWFSMEERKFAVKTCWS